MYISCPILHSLPNYTSEQFPLLESSDSFSKVVIAGRTLGLLHRITINATL